MEKWELEHERKVMIDFIAAKEFSKRRLRKFKKISWKMKLLVLGSFCLLGIIRLAILILPFRYLTLFMGEKMATSPNQINPKLLAKAIKVGWSVNKISNFTPWESKCLVRALTVQIILRVLKIPSTLYLGLAKDDSKQLLAHAWLRCGSVTITGARERESFTSVAQFATLTK